MSVTPIGWVLIPLGLVLLILRPRWLFILTVFFVPFSATAVINRGSGDSASGISPYLFFGFLMLLRECVNLTRRFRFRFARPLRRPLYLLMGFVLVCLASLIMPMLISGRLQIMDRPTIEYDLVPLQYSLQTVNHALSLIFDAVVTAVIAHRSLEVKQFYSTLRIYFVSGIFVCLWGWMQFGCYLAGTPYPAAVFNNNASPNALGYESVLESLGVVRVSSVALEPSFLSRVLVGMLAICVVAIYRKTPIFSRRLDYSVLALIGSTIVITTASTGYVGVAMLLVLLPFLPSERRTSKFFLVASGFIVLAALAAIYFTVPAAADLLNSQLFNKAEAGSVVERAVVISNDFQYFLDYPVLGIGWDSAPTHDVIVGLLANCGLCGLAAFGLLIGGVTFALRKSSALSTSGERRGGPPALMLLTLVITCGVYIISGGIELPDFWMILALSIAAVGVGFNNSQAACAVGDRPTLERYGDGTVPRFPGVPTPTL
jgi:hypothetical protein